MNKKYCFNCLNTLKENLNKCDISILFFLTQRYNNVKNKIVTDNSDDISNKIIGISQNDLVKELTLFLSKQSNPTYLKKSNILKSIYFLERINLINSYVYGHCKLLMITSDGMKIISNSSK